MNNSFKHSGTKRHSGRYPYGSGERPYQREGGRKKYYISEKEAKRKAAQMTNEDLQSAIDRRTLETKYIDYVTDPGVKRDQHKGREFISTVLENSAKNIATQATTYALGTALNKLIGDDIVNPKKGQKDR